MRIDFATSNAAPCSDKFLTMQPKAPPGNSTAPAFNTRQSATARFSIMPTLWEICLRNR